MEKTLGFPKFGYQGRLGNMLFELASCYGIANKSGRKLVLPEWQYQEFFKGKVEIVPRNILPFEVRELGFAYCGDYMYSRLANDKPHIDVSGYFQSEKYFKHCVDDVRKFFSWEESKFEHIREKYEHLLHGNTVAIHVRRGDYVGHSGYIPLPMKYYIDALREIDNRSTVVVFSDDIDWCKRSFSLIAAKIEFIEGNRNIDDLYLMSKMRNFIIANSTFSWWGAWLGEKNGGKIIHPGALFAGAMADYDIKDYFPDRWVVSNKWNN